MKKVIVVKPMRILGEDVTARQAPRPEPVKPAISFDQWWVLECERRKLSSALKEAVRKHFEARGFMQSGQFAEGLKDFGLS